MPLSQELKRRTYCSRGETKDFDQFRTVMNKNLEEKDLQWILFTTQVITKVYHNIVTERTTKNATTPMQTDLNTFSTRRLQMWNWWSRITVHTLDLVLVKNKITNIRESDKCDLCKVLWVSEGRFTTEKDLPVQTLGHIQHTCETLLEFHTMTHHRCWRLIHGELSHLASSNWVFICINSEKCFRTVWKELAQEFPEVFDQYVKQTLWNTARDT